MSNKRHAAALDDSSNVSLGALLKVIRSCQEALDESNEFDASLRFEILGDYIEEEIIKFGRPFTYTSRMIGI